MEASNRKNNANFSPVLCIKKLKGFNIIKKACMHNMREIPIELRAEGKIDSKRTGFNKVLIGYANSSEAKLQYDQMLESLKSSRRIRKDAVLGIEILFCLPSDHALNEGAFFSECIQWCEGYFKVFILSAIVHKDEANPHCHVILIPLINGRLQGSNLCGGRGKIRSMQEDFFKRVGINFGLTKPRPTVRYKSEYQILLATKAVDVMTENQEVLHADGVRKELIQLISSDPIDLARIIGIR